MSKDPAHQPSIEVLQPLPEDVAAGATVTAKVRVSCPHGCDLRGAALEVIAPGGARSSVALTSDEEEDAGADLRLAAPGTVGDATWQIVFPTQAIAGATHAEAATTVATSIKPHATSLAAWGFASPAIVGETIRVMVGAKCAHGCRLAGEPIAILDETGTPVADGTLGDAPWAGTDGLFWAEVEFAAPAKEGVATFSVRFATTACALPHDGASAGFSLMVARAPEHRVTVRVIEKETAAPITEADIRLHAYQARTDATGLATVGVPKGTYEVYVWKAGYEAEPVTVEVTGDLAVEIAALTLPEEDPDAHWQM
jgi:hypothetical protein